MEEEVKVYRNSTEWFGLYNSNAFPTSSLKRIWPTTAFCSYVTIPSTRRFRVLVYLQIRRHPRVYRRCLAKKSSVAVGTLRQPQLVSGSNSFRIRLVDGSFSCPNAALFRSQITRFWRNFLMSSKLILKWSKRGRNNTKYVIQYWKSFRSRKYWYLGEFLPREWKSESESEQGKRVWKCRGRSRSEASTVVSSSGEMRSIWLIWCMNGSRFLKKLWTLNSLASKLGWRISKLSQLFETTFPITIKWSSISAVAANNNCFNLP